MWPPSKRVRVPRSRLTAVVLACGSLVCLVMAGGSTPSARPAPLPEFFFHHDHILGTSLELHVVAPTQADAEACEQAILNEIERLRIIFSTYDAHSEISHLNRSSGPTSASLEILEVLRDYEIWQQRSQGAFNGQLGELVRTWKAAEKAGTLPTPAALEAIVRQINQPGWRIDESRQTVTRLTSQPLNLNSIAKGYIIQKAAAAARSQVSSLQGLLLNLGGDLALWGRDSAGIAGWTIGVQDPFHPEDNAPPLALLRLENRAVATSGGYERYYTIGGARYSHIFDPRTGRSAAGVASATVVARENVTANALATTLCVLSPQEGLRLVAATPGAECLVVAADGRQFRSAGWKALEVAPVRLALNQAAPAAPRADTWPPGYQVTVDLTLPTPTGTAKRIRRPYVAVWIENGSGKPVRTITVWGSAPRWQPTLTAWWAFGRNDSSLIRAVTRATRAPGKYQLVWDGKDDKGVALPQGTYTVQVEVHREHGKHVRQTGKLQCGTDPARITLAKNAETGETAVEYARRK